MKIIIVGLVGLILVCAAPVQAKMHHSHTHGVDKAQPPDYNLQKSMGERLERRLQCVPDRSRFRHRPHMRPHGDSPRHPRWHHRRHRHRYYDRNDGHRNHKHWRHKQHKWRRHAPKSSDIIIIIDVGTLDVKLHKKHKHRHKK